MISEGKVYHLHTIKCVSHSITLFLTLALDGVRGQLHTLASFLAGIVPPWYLLNRELGGPQALSEHFEKKKLSCSY